MLLARYITGTAIESCVIRRGVGVGRALLLPGFEDTRRTAVSTADLVFVIAATVTGAAWARAPGGHELDAVLTLRAAVAGGSIDVMEAELHDNPLQEFNAGDKAQKDLKTKIDAALVCAKSHPVLLRAVKDYYIAAVACFGAVSATQREDVANKKKLSGVLEEKETSLELEPKLAK